MNQVEIPVVDDPATRAALDRLVDERLAQLDAQESATDTKADWWDFASHMKTRDEVRGVVSPFPRWPFLEDIHRQQEENRLNIWRKPRQTFASNFNCGKRVYRAACADEANGRIYFGIIISKREDDSRELMNRIKFMYGSLPDNLRVPLKKQTETEMVFENGGRILALPASATIGHTYTATDVFIDEFARMPFDREIFAGIMPIIGQTGTCDIVSTVNGPFNMYASVWNSPEGEWHKIDINWWDHPDRDEAWAEREKARVCPDPDDDAIWRQQYLKEFEVFTEKPVYPGFKHFHVDNSIAFVPRETLYRGWDFGGHVNACVLWQYVKPTGSNHKQIQVLGEVIITDKQLSKEASVWYNPNNNIDDFCVAVLDYTRSTFPTCCRVRDFCDPAGAHVSDMSKRSERSKLAVMNEVYKIYPEYRFSNISEGIEIIRMRLRERPDGSVGLKISEKAAPVLTKAFQGGLCRRPPPPGKGLHTSEEIVKDGWYEHCLAKGTQVRTLSGWVPIEQLVGQDFWTYAYSHEEKRLVPAKATGCRLTRENAEVLTIVHDSGEITVTPDHPMMKRDGSFVRADQLSVGDSLMPFREAKNRCSNHKTIHLNDGSVAYEHLYVYSRLVGSLVDGCVVHHKDRDGGNNCPDNLQLMSVREHYDHHKKNHPLSGKSGGTHPWSEASRRKVKKSMLALRQSQKVERICTICGAPFWSWKTKQCSQKCKTKHGSLRRKALGLTGSVTTTFNHRVLAIKPHESTDVFNLEVSGYLNFPANGVIVHNCHDSFRYSVVGMFRTVEEGRGRQTSTARSNVRLNPLTGVPC